MRAKDKAHFIASWTEHINYISFLTQSLPLGEPSLEVLDIVKRLHEIKISASIHVYGEEPEEEISPDSQVRDLAHLKIAEANR